MAQELTIPGQEQLAGQLRRAARAGTLGQAVILSGQGDLLRCARFAAAASASIIPSGRVIRPLA